MGFGPKIDFSEAKGLEEEFLKGRHVREVMAALDGLKNQEHLNAQAARDHKSLDGIGRPTAHIDPFVYWWWAAREGGQEVWQDKQHMRYMRNAGMQMVKAGGTKTAVRGADIPGSKRFHKSYGEWKPPTT